MVNPLERSAKDSLELIRVKFHLKLKSVKLVTTIELYADLLDRLAAVVS